MRSRSAVDDLAHNQEVAGSTPASATILAGIAQLVEQRIRKAQVMSSRLISGSIARIAQLVELLICNQAVVGSNPTSGSI